MEGKKQLISCLLENQIKEMFRDLNNFLKVDFKDLLIKMYLNNENCSNYFENLYIWFEEEYRPQVIRNDILIPFKEHKNVLDLKICELLKDFENFCRQVINFGINGSNNNKKHDKKLLEDIDILLNELASAFL